MWVRVPLWAPQIKTQAKSVFYFCVLKWRTRKGGKEKGSVNLFPDAACRVPLWAPKIKNTTKIGVFLSFFQYTNTHKKEVNFLTSSILIQKWFYNKCWGG